MKITRRQLKQIILEAFKDLSSILPGPKPAENKPRRRISRRDPRTGRPIKNHPIRGFVRDIGDEIPQTPGVPAIVTTKDDIKLSPTKRRNLTKESPFVGGSANFHATYSSNYTEDDLSFFMKKYDPSLGRERHIKIRRDEPDHKEGDYVINPALFNNGEMGVMKIFSDNVGTRDFRMTIDGESVVVPLFTLKSITTGETVSDVGKAFVKKVAGSKSFHKAEEIESNFRPKIKTHRE